jgi:hypothetical protein
VSDEHVVAEVVGALARIGRGSSMLRSVRARKRSVHSIEADLRHVRSTVDRLLESENSRAADAASRRRMAIWIGFALALVFSLVSVGLLVWSLPASPTASAPGRIGLVLPEGARNGSVQVHADFSGKVDSPASFQVVVSVIPQTDTAPTTPTSIGFLFCGDIRLGLRLTEANTPDQPAPVGVESDSLESDSRLGDRRECDFVTITSQSWQVILQASSDLRLATADGKRVLYALPGVTTTAIDETINGSVVHPLPSGTSLDVAMADVPVDLTVSAAAPQIPAAGDLAWSFADLRTTNAPNEYRIAGELGDRENLSEFALFTAGALIGIAGAALLWALEALFDGPRRRSRR